MLLNAQQPGRLFKLLVYGESGVGKTHLGVTAPDPVILLAERQGFETIRDAAQMLGKPVPPSFWIRSRDDFADAIRALQSESEPLPAMVARAMKDDPEAAEKTIAELPYTKPKTVVIDSMTEIFQLLWDHMLEQAPPKTAKDGLPEVGKRHWGTMRDRAQAMIRTVRDLPYNVLFLALLDDREVGEDEQKERVVQPQAPMRAIPSMMVAAVNAAGVAKRDRLTRMDPATGDRVVEIRRYVQFLCPSFVLAKPIIGLDGDEEPDVSAWLAKLDTHVEERQAQSNGKKEAAKKRKAKAEASAGGAK